LQNKNNRITFVQTLKRSEMIEIEELIKRLETEINKTSTGELRNLLCDVNIVLQHQVLNMYTFIDPLDTHFNCKNCGKETWSKEWVKRGQCANCGEFQ